MPADRNKKLEMPETKPVPEDESLTEKQASKVHVRAGLGHVYRCTSCGRTIRIVGRPPEDWGQVCDHCSGEAA